MRHRAYIYLFDFLLEIIVTHYIYSCVCECVYIYIHLYKFFSF